MPGSYKVYTFLGNKPVTSNSSTSSRPANSTVPSTGNKGNSTQSPLLIQAPSKNGTATNYFEHPDYVGSHTFLGGSVAKTNASNPVLTEGSIPLTACLQGKVEDGELKSLHPDHVEPYLEKNLHYKIVGPNGQEFEPAQVPNFHAKVKSCPVEPAPEGQLPTFKEYIDLPRVNLPASAPWTPPPPPVPSTPIGSMPMPWDEPGYCVSSQTIEYVDSNGKFLYRETH
jgi:tyrosinase